METTVGYTYSLHPKDIELKRIFQESATYISRALWIHTVPTNCGIKSNVEDSLEKPLHHSCIAMLHMV